MIKNTDLLDQARLVTELLRLTRRESLVLGTSGLAGLLSFSPAFAADESRMTQEDKERLRQEEALARDEDADRNQQNKNDIRDQIGVDSRNPACGLWGLTEIQRLATASPGEPPGYNSVPYNSYFSDSTSRQFLSDTRDQPSAASETIRASSNRYHLFNRPPELPAGESYDANLKALGSDPSGVRSLIAARDAQRLAFSAMPNKGIWDYKVKYGLAYEDAGNFNYGLIAAALGVPEQAALRYAGWYQINRGSVQNPEWGHWTDLNSTGPYGDQPEDQVQIRRGYEYYRHKDLVDTLYEGQRRPSQFSIIEK